MGGGGGGNYAAGEALDWGQLIQISRTHIHIRRIPNTAFCGVGLGPTSHIGRIPNAAKWRTQKTKNISDRAHEALSFADKKGRITKHKMAKKSNLLNAFAPTREGFADKKGRITT